jgi:hypothetical protein
MCNGCCCCCAPAGPTPPPPDGGPGPRCTRYVVTIQSIDVTAIDDGFLGGNLEATFTFTVNGQVQTYVNNSLDVGVSPIGITFFVDVPADTSTISVDVSGVEDDPFFDDTLPGFAHIWTQAQNWGVGAQSGAGSDSNITYTLNYTIACAQRTTVSISRSTLRAYGEDRVRTREGAESRTPAVLESWALDRLRRSAGWEVVSATQEQYVLAGYGTMPALLERKYGGGVDATT